MSAAEILDLPLYGGTMFQWAAALGVAVALVLVARLAKPMLIRQLGSAAQRTPIALDDAVIHALRATRIPLVALVALAVGSQLLELPARPQKVVGALATIALFLQVGLWVASLLQFWLERSETRARATDPGAATSLAAVGFVGRIVLWALILLLILDNLGINVTTLIAGLGIGGIAVALAAQNILGDLFASLSIVIDKPFVVGDFIIVDDYMGSVEHIGLKTTRIRSLDGEQIIFSNGDLLKTRLRNYKRMRERRVVFPLRLRYETTTGQLAKVPGIVRRLLESHKEVRFERSHFHRFGDSSLDLETVFWVTTPDYNVYMDIQQAVNLALMDEFEKAGIEFAFPTRTLRMSGPLEVETLAAADGEAGGGKKAAAKGKDEPEAPGRH